MPKPRAPLADLQHVMQHAGDDLRALQGAHIFITGGTGYIGRWLLEMLRHVGIRATVLSRHPVTFAQDYPHLAEAFTFIAGDVRDFEFPKGSFTHCIHAATDVVATKDDEETLAVTMQGSRRVLDFCAQAGVERILLLSSGAVYGEIPASLSKVPEDFAGTPTTAYGRGKLAMERMSDQAVSARVFAQVGPYLALDKHFAVGNFIGHAIRNEPMVIKGDGTALRSYMHAADLMIWLFALLVRGQKGRAYNVGSDVGVSIRDLAEVTAKAAGVAPQVQVLGQPAPGAAPNRYVPDIARARDELGLDITLPLDAALARSIAWFREDDGQ